LRKAAGVLTRKRLKVAAVIKEQQSGVRIIATQVALVISSSPETLGRTS
jgi:hypothetical protein